MTTRRTFIARALASLAAAAGLSRFAPGAGGAAEPAKVPQPEKLRLTFSMQWANISEYHNGRWLRAYRVVTFDERGYCVEVSSKRYVDSRGQAVEVSPEVPQ